MEKSNQPPKTEGCLAEGEPVDLWYYRVEQPSRSVPRETREPQAGPASCLSHSASKVPDASGDGVFMPEPKIEMPVQGEGVEGLPGSESVARVEGGARNRGGPGSPCRTNCEGQAGREAQRQEASPDPPGVGLAHSIPRQGVCPKAGEGGNKSTQSSQVTGAVRTTKRTQPARSPGRTASGPNMTFFTNRPLTLRDCLAYFHSHTIYLRNRSLRSSIIEKRCSLTEKAGAVCVHAGYATGRGAAQPPSK